MLGTNEVQSPVGENEFRDATAFPRARIGSGRGKLGILWRATNNRNFSGLAPPGFFGGRIHRGDRVKG